MVILSLGRARGESFGDEERLKTLTCSQWLFDTFSNSILLFSNPRESRSGDGRFMGDFLSLSLRVGK